MRAILENKVIEWAEKRDIFKKSNVLKQLDKTAEEREELVDAIAIYKVNPSTENFHDVKMEYGDILVTLVLAGQFLGIDSYEALLLAYDKISKRKGEMVDGFYVKEE